MKFRNYLGVITAFYLIQAAVLLTWTDAILLIEAGNLFNWDAEHYGHIALNGYDSLRTAFFPLFPYIWYVSNLNEVGVSILNGLVFIGSFAWIAKMFQTKLHHLLLIAATPVFIFFFLPYTESWFFLGSTLIIAGYKKDRLALLILGFFLCSLTRPPAAVFIPAIFLTELLTGSNRKKSLIKALASSASVIVGMLIAFTAQWLYTGKFLAFFNTQNQHWNNTLQLPAFPLRSWAGLGITALDGIALFVALVCGVVLFRKVLKGKFPINGFERSELFSMLYLFGIGLLVLLFRGGELFSLNRFVFASAFFVVVAFRYSRKIQPLKSLYYILGLFCFWLLFNSYVHIQAFLKYAGITAFCSLAVLSFSEKKRLSQISMLLLFMGFVALQLFFYYHHLSGEWIA